MMGFDLVAYFRMQLVGETLLEVSFIYIRLFTAYITRMHNMKVKVVEIYRKISVILCKSVSSS